MAFPVWWWVPQKRRLRGDSGTGARLEHDDRGLPGTERSPDLPPAPPIDWTGERQRRLERATLALGRLDAVSTLLPDTMLFLYSYVRREAVLSSQIEGTQSSLSDLLMFELDVAPGVPLDDVVEVSNYVAAMEHGLARLRDGFPVSNRLIREMHGLLLASGRGSASTGTSTTGSSGRSGPTVTGRRGSTSSSRVSSRPPAVPSRRRTASWS